MSCNSSISSFFLKKSIQFYASTSHYPKASRIIPSRKLHVIQTNIRDCSLVGPRIFCLADNPSEFPGKSPQEIPTVQPADDPAVPQEMPQTPNVPDFDPIPPEKPADPPPLGPSPGPEFPGPPNPSPPKPEAPVPPMHSPPREPEVVPPHGPDVIPPKPPDLGPPYLTQPEIPPPIMGSDGLVFY